MADRGITMGCTTVALLAALMLTLHRVQPMAAEANEATEVSCGSHKSTTGCAGCPQGHGADWCNGDCTWVRAAEECVPKPVHVDNEAVNKALQEASDKGVVDATHEEVAPLPPVEKEDNIFRGVSVSECRVNCVLAIALC